jgi:hypothetical protein
MLCSPSLVGPKFGFRRFASFTPDETLEATLLEKATSLSNLLTDGAPLAPAAAASFDVVSLCARFIAGDHDPELLGGHEWRFMERYALLRSDNDATNHTADFASALAELVETTAASLQLPALETLVTPLRMAVYQAVRFFVDQDEELRPYYVTELALRLADKLLHRRSEEAVQLMRDIGTELVGALASEPEASLDLHIEKYRWLDPNAPVEPPVQTRVNIRWDVPQPQDTTDEARLARLQLRRQALLDADGDKTEIAWIEFSIEVVRNDIAQIRRRNANLATTPQLVIHRVPISS